MTVTITIEVTRDDDKDLSAAQKEAIREQVQSEVENISLDEITLYEGTPREESVSLTVEVREVK